MAELYQKAVSNGAQIDLHVGFRDLPSRAADKLWFKCAVVYDVVLIIEFEPVTLLGYFQRSVFLELFKEECSAASP